MNLNKNRLIPSPRANHARKPFISIATIQTHSLDRMKTRKSPFVQKSHMYNSFCKERGEVELKEIQPESVSMQAKQKEIKLETIMCQKHPQRKAMNYTIKYLKQYLCFECSLYQARNGTKLIPVPEQKDQRAKELKERETQIVSFLKETYHLERMLQVHHKQQILLLDNLEMNYSDLLKSQKQKFEAAIKKLEQQFFLKIDQINKYRGQEVERLKSLSHNVEERCKRVVSQRMDVQKNYQHCLQQFSSSQFKSIMNQYWSQVEECQKFLQKHPKKTPSFFTERPHFAESPKNLKEFTFSKANAFKTPKSNTKFEGVPLISSNTNQTDHIHTDKQLFSTHYPNSGSYLSSSPQRTSYPSSSFHTQFI